MRKVTESARRARGMVYNGKGEYDNAIKDFDVVTEKVTGREPEKLRDRADAYAERSHSLYQQGKYLEAIDSAYFATLEKERSYPAHLNCAFGVYRSTRIRQSCEQFKSSHQRGRKIG